MCNIIGADWGVHPTPRYAQLGYYLVHKYATARRPFISQTLCAVNAEIFRWLPKEHAPLALYGPLNVTWANWHWLRRRIFAEPSTAQAAAVEPAVLAISMQILSWKFRAAVYDACEIYGSVILYATEHRKRSINERSHLMSWYLQCFSFSPRRWVVFHLHNERIARAPLHPTEYICGGFAYIRSMSFACDAVYIRHAGGIVFVFHYAAPARRHNDDCIKIRFGTKAHETTW